MGYPAWRLDELTATDSDEAAIAADLALLRGDPSVALDPAALRALLAEHAAMRARIAELEGADNGAQEALADLQAAARVVVDEVKMWAKDRDAWVDEEGHPASFKSLVETVERLQRAVDGVE